MQYLLKNRPNSRDTVLLFQSNIYRFPKQLPHAARSVPVPKWTALASQHLAAIVTRSGKSVCYSAAAPCRAPYLEPVVVCWPSRPLAATVEACVAGLAAGGDVARRLRLARVPRSHGLDTPTHRHRTGPARRVFALVFVYLGNI